MSKNTTVSLLVHVPAKATKQNIKSILHTMETFDRRADRAYQKGDFSRATQYSNFVYELDCLLTRLGDASPLWKEAF